jgi:hypothetical protein
MKEYPMSLDQAFRDIMSQSQKDFQDAQVINNWRPDPGDYSVVLKEPVAGVKADGQNAGPWMKLAGTILNDTDPNLHGREFTVGFYTTKNLSGMKNDVAVLAGKIVNSVTEAMDILSTVAGWVVNVNVRSYISKKTGERGTIVQITNILDRAINQPS